MELERLTNVPVLVSQANVDMNKLFTETLDHGWAGPNVDRAKAFAFRIAEVHSKQLVGCPVDVTCYR